uniref:Uncharacterized protein n=1 Tax=Hyaloperonospora arabidopsidis (strain Emoy2) TaxID=559515 RepID=M4BV12_HYAAE
MKCLVFGNGWQLNWREGDDVQDEVSLPYFGPQRQLHDVFGYYEDVEPQRCYSVDYPN